MNINNFHFKRLKLSKIDLAGKEELTLYERETKRSMELQEYNQIVVQNFRTEIKIYNKVMLHQMWDYSFLLVMLRGLFR